MPVDLSGLTTKAPPRKSDGTPTRKPRLSAPTKKSAREEAVTGVFQLVQFACVTGGNYADAAAIGAHAENISHEIVELADVNESVAKAIDFLLTAGPYAGLVTACLPLVLQIMANHNRIPENTPGVTPPSLMKMQFEVQLKQQKLAMQQQASELAEMARRLEEADQAQTASQNGQTPQNAVQSDTGMYL